MKLEPSKPLAGQPLQSSMDVAQEPLQNYYPLHGALVELPFWFQGEANDPTFSVCGPC